jgi:hypothetical protein
MATMLAATDLASGAVPLAHRPADAVLVETMFGRRELAGGCHG